MSRILLVGALGQANPGDDALLDAFVDGLAGHDLVVATPGPAPAGTTAVPATAAGVGVGLRHADAVVVTGGTVLKSLHPAAGRHHLGLLVRTRLLQLACTSRGIPLALAGVGAGELRSRSARRLAARIARSADLLVLRDEESAGILEACGVPGPFRIGADPAWSLLRDRVAAPSDAGSSGFGSSGAGRAPAGRGLLVAVSHLAGPRADDVVVLLEAACRAAVDAGHQVHLQPWQPGADEDLARAVVLRMADPRASVLPRPVDLDEAVATSGAHAGVLALRFHAAVAAAAAGVPTLSVAHEPKLAGLARRIAQPTVPATAVPAVVRAAVDALLDPDRSRPPSRAALAEQVRLADQDLRLLRVVVSRGAEDGLIDDDRTPLGAGIPW